ncbi:MAG: DUF1573 domain-containing protein, partial [Phycisphaerales bacterium]|nr:DUF1573 domain-containing protein [Phycisphaerales bacterium]
SVDFGVVTPGSTQEAQFVLQNRSASSVRVAKVTPSCKCTAISLTEGTQIPAGGTVSFRASLAVPRTPGEKEAKVFIVLEGTTAPLMAMIRAVASLPVQASPTYIDALKNVTSGEVVLSSIDAKPFRILSVDGRTPVLAAATLSNGESTSASPPAASYKLRWDIPTPAAGETLPLWWIVETDRDDAPLIPLRIRHETTGTRADPGKDARYWFFPEALVLAGRIKSDQRVELSTEIEHLNVKGRGRVERPDWSEVVGVKSLASGVNAELISARLVADHVEVKFALTIGAGHSGFISVPIEIETKTGKGVVPVAASVQVP